MGTTIACRAFLTAYLVAGSLGASNPALAAGVSSTVEDPSIYILFLRHNAQHKSGSASGTGGFNGVNRATQLHVKPSELSIIDQKALAYFAEDQRIHTEALQYRAACIRDHKPLDPAIVHSFTTRRLSEATAAFADIRSGLSEASYAGLQQYLHSVFTKGVRRQPVR